MTISENIIGMQHIGLPTKSVEETIAFYKRIGFEVMWRSPETMTEHDVVFLKNKTCVIEAYKSDSLAGIAGAIDHLCLDVKDIEEAYSFAKAEGFEIINPEIVFLPFLENGVRYFMILGPSGEKVEFNQIL